MENKIIIRQVFYEIKGGERMKANLLPSLSTIQFQGIQALADEAKLQQNYVELPPKDISILPMITIPMEYRLSNNISQYNILLSMDEHTLRVVATQEAKDAVITISNSNNPIVLNEQVRIVRVSVIGQLNYNILLTGFETKNHLSGNRSVLFNTSGSIPINYVLGYTTLDFYNPNHLVNQYVISVTQEEEYLITDDDVRINRSDLEYFQYLKQMSTNVSLGIPYVVTIASSNPPIC